MSIVPASCGGEVAVMEMLLATVKEGAGVDPKNTPVAPKKLLPVIMTVVPPPVPPLVVLMLLIPGTAAALYVYRSDAPVADVPLAVVTVMSTVPAGSAGEVAVILVDEFTVKLLAATLPKSTEVAPVKLVPLIVTDVPPPVVPDVGLIEVTVGTAVLV